MKMCWYTNDVFFLTVHRYCLPCTVAAWYKIVNFFCDLGNLEKMYIPPLVDPSLGLEENQILIENKMALAAASGAWNATLINGLDETLPPQYKQRYVVHKVTGKKSILPAKHNITSPSEYALREMDILELGCGKGRILHDMTMYTGGNGNGINIDRSQLDNAIHFAQSRDLFPHRLNFTHASLNDAYPFENESMDFAYEVGAFTYVIDKLAVFKEIYRVLRPGGAFCYNDWTLLESFDPADENQVAKLLKIKKFSGLIELHNPEELAAVAEEAGFEVIWNGHGGYGAVPTSGLLGNMHHSFRYADSFMQFMVNYGLLPDGLAKGWKLLRDGKGVHILKESMDKKWLDVGHIFLVRKPHH